MATVEYRYGGARGRRRRLADSSEFLVVRTRDREPLEHTPVGPTSLRSLRGFERVARFEDAGVEVLRAPEGPRRGALRNAARTALQADAALQFAARGLVASDTREPVVYTENLFVKFGDDVGPRVCRRLLRERELEIKRELDYARNAFFVGAPEGSGRAVFEHAGSLLGEKAVELCHPELVRPSRERAAFPQQWHLQRARVSGNSVDEHANVVRAWQLSEGEGVTIAVIDDGFDLDHEEFAGAGKLVAPRDVTRRRDDARPQFATDRHGTACAGVACANGNHGASGVAPRARLMPIRLRSALGSQNEADALAWAARHGADVISCSWGPEDGDFRDPDDPRHDVVTPLPDSTRLAIDFAVDQGRNGLGCVITWAAGNGDESVDHDGYASYERVIAVAASDDRGRKAPYSDTGEALWCAFPSNHFFPSLTPGIWTTDRSDGAGYNPGRVQLGDAEGHYTNNFGGTSSACPGAAGVAALVLARNPALRWDQVRDVLRRSCDRIGPAGGYDADGHSTSFGYGRLNARRAVELALPARPTTTVLHRASRDVAVVDHATSRLSVEVGDRDPIQDLRVELDIEHTFRGDLVVALEPPSALGLDAIVLHDGEGGGAANLKRRYDRASTPGLAALVGQLPTGTWSLRVHDRATHDQGRIVAFAVELDL